MNICRALRSSETKWKDRESLAHDPCGQVPSRVLSCHRPPAPCRNVLLQPCRPPRPLDAARESQSQRTQSRAPLAWAGTARTRVKSGGVESTRPSARRVGSSMTFCVLWVAVEQYVQTKHCRTTSPTLTTVNPQPAACVSCLVRSPRGGLKSALQWFASSTCPAQCPTSHVSVTASQLTHEARR